MKEAKRFFCVMAICVLMVAIGIVGKNEFIRQYLMEQEFSLLEIIAFLTCLLLIAIGSWIGMMYLLMSIVSLVDIHGKKLLVRWRARKRRVHS